MITNHYVRILFAKICVRFEWICQLARFTIGQFDVDADWYKSRVRYFDSRQNKTAVADDVRFNTLHKTARLTPVQCLVLIFHRMYMLTTKMSGISQLRCEVL